MTYRALALGLVLGFGAAVIPGCGTVRPPAKCNSTSCPDGCCEGGECYTGTSPDACGTGAASCVACNTGESCVTGQCRIGTDGGGGGAGGSGGSGGGTGSCNAGNCATGCCKTDGTCQTVGSAQACGTNGAACSACGFGQTCTSGTCTSTGTCTTCRLANGNCLDGGINDNTCGNGGQLCQRCDTVNGQRCNSSGQCTGGPCGSNNCSDGCCSGTTCIRDAGVAQCGTGGVACISCSGTARCVSGTCTGGGSDGGFNPDAGFGTCDINSCPTGCCVQGLGVCLPGTDDFSCGTGAVDCAICIFQLKTCNQGTKTCQ